MMVSLCGLKVGFLEYEDFEHCFFHTENVHSKLEVKKQRETKGSGANSSKRSVLYAEQLKI